MKLSDIVLAFILVSSPLKIRLAFAD